jgi:hypothetical protein
MSYYEQQEGVPDLQKMTELANKMSHGIETALTYIRKK